MRVGSVGAVEVAAQEGGSWLRKVGPKVRLADRHGATELAVRAVNQDGGVELQLRRILLF